MSWPGVILLLGTVVLCFWLGCETGWDSLLSGCARSMGRVYKPVINMDSGDYRHIVCAWADCERQGYENNKIVTHEHARPVPCDSPLARHIQYVFCSERHRNMWGESSGWRAHRLAEQHQGRIHGMLPTGSRGGIL